MLMMVVAHLDTIYKRIACNLIEENNVLKVDRIYFNFYVDIGNVCDAEVLQNQNIRRL